MFFIYDEYFFKIIFNDNSNNFLTYRKYCSVNYIDTLMYEEGILHKQAL